MKGTDFEGSTFNLVKPENMAENQCDSLPATSGVDVDGFPFILVAFEPSAQDIMAFETGGKLFLKVMGTSFAPVSLFTIDDKGNVNPQ